MYDISILMPSYNQGDYIEEAINSVLSQKGVRAQLIVMDGGSSDQTTSILNKYKSHILFRTEPDNGQAHALNKALAVASAPIIGWLNSDDFYLPGAFRTVRRAFQSNPCISLLYGRRVLVDSNSAVVGWSVSGQFNPDSDRFNICSETSFWKANCVPALKFREDLNFAMDAHFLSTIASCRQHLYLNRYIACFRCHSSAKSSTLWVEQGMSEASEVWRSLFGRQIKLNPPETPDTMYSKYRQAAFGAQLPLPFALSYLKRKVSEKLLLNSRAKYRFPSNEGK